MSVLIDGQASAGFAAGSPARPRRLKLVADGDRPCAQMRYVPSRECGPRQPARPLAGAPYSITAVCRTLVREAEQRQPASGRAGLTLSDRGLAAVMIGFALAVVLGAWMIVSQYLALGLV